MQEQVEDESSFGELLELVRGTVLRRRWWILASICVTPVLTLVILSFIPNSYKSEATLVVVQQQVPERYVVPNSTTDITSELQAMKQEVLSRSQLQEIIRKFGLYKKVAARLAPEQIVEKMLRDIEIVPIEAAPTRKDFDAFKISFTTDNPLVAQQVTSTLTSLFIREDLKTREQQATNTTNFLDEQLASAKAKLSELEEKLRDFKTQYLGELPEQQSGNLGILASLQTQLQNTMATISRAQEQRVYLQSLLSGMEARDSARVASAATGAIPSVRSADPNRRPGPLEAAQDEVSRLEAERTALLSRLTPHHPDVIRIDDQLASANSRLEKLRLAAARREAAVAQAAVAEGSKASPVPTVVSATDDPAVAQLKGQLEANRLEIENLTKDQEKFKAGLAEYEKRLNLTPVREQQLTGILREYDLQKTNYSDLLSKELQSKLATNLEKQQGGQQFRLIDPPSLPVVPSSPKREKINLGGLAGGIVLGLALAFLMEMKDPSLHSEQQLLKCFPSPLVVSIPLVILPAEQRSRNWKRSFEWLGGCVVLLVVCVAEFYAYRHT
jgi:polysaccharide biosynthesis transport protein